MEAVNTHTGTEWAENYCKDVNINKGGPSWASVVAADSNALCSSTNGSVERRPGREASSDDQPTHNDRTTGPTEMVKHKAEVPPVFVEYCCVSAEGERISLMQIATAVLHMMGDQGTLDAVQPMKQGWYIYMHTLADRVTLVERGLTIAG